MGLEEERLFIPLAFPPASLRLKRIQGTIHVWCDFRRKFLVLTPEEWVRQHIVHHLVHELGYPAGYLSLEKGTTYQQMLKRTDVLVFDSYRKPLMLIECKAASVALSSEVLHQAAQYNNTIAAPFVIITNGITTQVIQISKERNTMKALNNIPDWKSISLN
jgi:hypothetical protein